MALLEVSDLSVSFHTRHGVVPAVQNMSYTLDHGAVMGIVGESGSGKSVSCYSLLGLIPCPPGRIESGTARFAGQDLLRCTEDQLRGIAGSQIAMIFQDPMTSLNPYLRIGEQLMEPLLYHRGFSRAKARARALELLEEVSIRDPKHTIDAYPHEFSGGMRQRVMIAMALIAEPKLLIADEPTTALDVTVQRQILHLIDDLRRRRNLALIYISHDLGVVATMADHVLVMQNGRVVEQGQAQNLFSAPQHEYTRKLLAAIPGGAKPAAVRGTPATSEPLVSVRDLTTQFGGPRDAVVAVNRVSFDLQRGEILGLVGESGSGKSTLGRSILGLVSPNSGSVRFDGTELVGLAAKQLRPLRRHMQMIFQDPYASLNPRMSIYDALAEPLRVHGLADRVGVGPQVLRLMDEVGLARAYVRKYPHEFSGGQRQRIAIGRAIATKPQLVIADEPVSALDVTIQKQILELLLQLVQSHHLSMLFISHDLAVVRSICDRVMVMHHGSVVEQATTEELWGNPSHDYTKVLLAAAPTFAT